VRPVLRRIAEFGRRWTGSGATRNAHIEIERTRASVRSLEEQLRRVGGPPTRRVGGPPPRRAA